MMRSSRKPANLSESLHHRLNSYALAASAAGVSLLALAQPADAKIIYTKAHAKIGYGGQSGYALDLNHDGVIDFEITAFKSHHTEGTIGGRPLTATWNTYFLDAKGDGNNGVEGSGSAAALRRGKKIGPANRFAASKIALIKTGNNSTESSGGKWCNVSGYLGLKFSIKDRPHYGWAAFRVSCSFSINMRPELTGILSGYAYETIPNKPIVAGKTQGPDVVTIQTGSLGQLARGASAIPAWRTTP